MKGDSKIIGKKVKERWYPIYVPHIILGTNKSILDYISNGTDTSRNLSIVPKKTVEYINITLK
jgi:hypothetical protein